MIILDTNVLSALMRRIPDEQALHWLDKQPRTSIWITSITVLEIRYGLQIMPLGKRRAALVQAFDSLVAHKINERIAPFDTAAAQRAGELMALRHERGQPGDLRDTMIAGIVLACHATLATRNTSHFGDLSVPLVNPWATGSASNPSREKARGFCEQGAGTLYRFVLNGSRLPKSRPAQPEIPNSIGTHPRESIRHRGLARKLLRSPHPDKPTGLRHWAAQNGVRPPTERSPRG